MHNQEKEIAQNYLNDSFYLNTKKPISLYQKFKNKLAKYTKPFTLGISIYLAFEIIKNISIKAFNFILDVYSYTGQLFGSWFESIGNFLLNAGTHSSNYQCYGISQLASHCSAHKITSITELINITCYIFTIGFRLKSLIKFKEYNDTKGETPISQPIVYALVAALLFALPTLFTVSTSAIWSGHPQGLLNPIHNL